MVFLLAPAYNGGMKNVGKERRELGTRTIFNMLGPLLNPAPLTGQLMGVYDETLIDAVGKVLLELGLDRALVVHGNDGLDELTTTTTSTVCELKDGKLRKFTLDPKYYGIPYANIKDIAGGEAKENARIIIDILNGKKGPERDIVVLNAGAGFFSGKITDSIEEGIALANKLLDEGTALAKYNELKEA